MCLLGGELPGSKSDIKVPSSAHGGLPKEFGPEDISSSILQATVR